MQDWKSEVSPNHKLLAVTEDFTGDEVYTLRVIDIDTGQSVGKLITGVTERMEWAKDNETIFYVTQDDVHRPYKVWRHKLNNAQFEDTCLYHEQNALDATWFHPPSLLLSLGTLLDCKLRGCLLGGACTSLGPQLTG